MECFTDYMNNIKFEDEIYLLGGFNINLLQNRKDIPRENQAMQNQIPSTSLMILYKFCQRFSLEHMINQATCMYNMQLFHTSSLHR